MPPSFPILLLALAPPTGGDDGVELAQLTIHERIVVRIQRAAPAAPLPSAPVLVEKKAPKCIAMDTLAGALITRPGYVDLVVAGGRRLRAHLGDDCPGIDFYGGFYLKPTRDGKVCAGRDAVRARSGGQCRIERFRTLVPARR